MEILNYNTLIEVVLILLLYLYYKLVPTNGQMHLNVKELERQVYKLSEKLSVNEMEMWEHMEGTLKPLTAKLRTRIQRAQQAEEKDLKNQEPLKKKGGIINPADYKKYGFNR